MLEQSALVIKMLLCEISSIMKRQLLCGESSDRKKNNDRDFHDRMAWLTCWNMIHSQQQHDITLGPARATPLPLHTEPGLDTLTHLHCWRSSFKKVVHDKINLKEQSYEI